MAALSAAALLLAALSSSSAAAANDGQQGQAGGYVQPAYHRPVDGLDPGYYQHSCPDMEGIVQRAVKKAVAADYSLAAALIRLFFHDFAVGVGVDYWPLKYGRKDGRKSSAAEADQYVPMGRESVTDLFADSMRRLGAVQVLSGNEGEVRLKCSAVNSY
ncbi:hypothetical protein ABZP36_002410 [Zizania latifolia]